MFGFSKPSLDASDQYVFFHEDYSSKEVNETLVGRKAYSSFQLQDMDVPVPDFFSLSPSVYQKFLLDAFDGKLADLLKKVNDPDVKELEKLIMKGRFESAIAEEVERAYARLSGFSDAWVAVRSSVVYPKNQNVSFSGLFGTELNVRGYDELLEAVKQVYLSVFRNRVVVYAKDRNVDLADLKMSILVQKMVQPVSSGVAYTLDPVTSDDKKMSIEAVFGLGDVIAEGAITPDQYTLNKKDLDIIEKHISPQEWMKVRKPKDENSRSQEEEKIRISKTWSHQQKLEDDNIKEVAKIALIAEDKSNQAQSIEWVWESGNVWVLQNKPLAEKTVDLPTVDAESVKDESLFDVAIDIVKSQKLEDSDAELSKISKESLKQAKDSVEDDMDKAKEVQKASEEQLSALEKLSKKLKDIKAKSDKDQSDEKAKLAKEQSRKLAELGLVSDSQKSKTEFLLTGIGASNGEVAGEVRVLNTPIPNDMVVTKGTILLVKEFKPEMESLILQSGGIVMDEGGLTSDVSIIAREANIPAVVGTGLATALIQDKDIIKIDGSVGSVYRVTAQSKEDELKAAEDEAVQKVADNIRDESIVNAAKRAEEKSKVTEASASSDSDGNDAELPTTDKVKTATKVLLNPEIGVDVDRYASFVKHVDGVTFIDLDELLLQDKRHALAYADDGKFREFSKDFEKYIDAYTDAVGGEEVVVSIGSGTVGRFREQVKGTSMEEKSLPEHIYGVQRLINTKEYLVRAISIIKKVRNVYRSRNLSIAIHAPMNGEMMKEVKKVISGEGLRRTGTFNIYAIIDNPAEVILADEITEAGIDGLIINTPRLARQMQGLGLYTENAKYDIGVSSVMKIVENAVLQVRAKENLRLIVVAEDNQDLIKQCVEWGVYGVTTLPNHYDKAKKLVSETETNMIMRIGVVS